MIHLCDIEKLFVNVTYRGRTPAEAELMYLENAKKLDMYGLHLQQAKVLSPIQLVYFLWFLLGYIGNFEQINMYVCMYVLSVL